TGDGRTDAAVFRPSTGYWYVRGMTPIHYGVSGDVPVPADYTGDQRADLALFRPSTSYWYVRGVMQIHWGATGDTALPPAPQAR
ncbi:MAG: hypothetical protein ABR571_13490, partial [Jatrophihabitans sp.]